MNHSKETPIYNLKAVVQETGIKPDTLRAWERRYDLPKPQRTASGHRLYSQHDIDMLHWLMARQDDGLSISRAIEMWQHIQNNHEIGSSVNTSSTHIPSTASEQRSTTSSANGSTTLSNFRTQWIKACINFNQPLADQLLSEAFALFPAETVCIKLIQRGLAEIGDDWYRGTVTVQQEHFASSIAIRRMETMLTATPDPTRNGRILIGNPPNEEHTFVPLMLSLLLRRRGWDVIYLGANVPLASLDTTIATIKPNLVILTAQQICTAASLLDMAQALVQERTPLAFGGLIFNQVPEMANLIPGYFLGEMLEDAANVVEQIMASLRVKLAQHTVNPEYRAAFFHFQERRAQIEAALWHRSSEIGMTQRNLMIANEKLGGAIAAALQLGNINYAQPTVRWLESTLLNHHQLSAETIASYFSAYAQAVQSHLGESAEVVRDWFASNHRIEEPALSMVRSALRIAEK